MNPYRGNVGRHVGHLEDYFGPFGVSWDHLRGILGVMWAILGHLGDISGVKGGSWGALWAALGHAGKNNEKSTSRTRLFGSILGRFLESFLVPFFDDILDMRFDVFLVAGVKCFLLFLTQNGSIFDSRSDVGANEGLLNNVCFT